MRHVAVLSACVLVLAGCVGSKSVLVYDAYHHHPDGKGHGGGWYMPDDTGHKGYSKADKILSDKYERRMRHEPFQAASFHRDSVYLIVNPDNTAHRDAPNYISDREAEEITAFVESGGTLVLFANYPGHCEFTKMNALANQFGLRFNDNGTKDELVTIPVDGTMFDQPLKLHYMYGCTIKVSEGCRADFVIKNEGDKPVHGPIIVGIRYGDGKVLAVGDAGTWSNEGITRQDTAAVFQRIMSWARPDHDRPHRRLKSSNTLIR